MDDTSDKHNLQLEEFIRGWEEVLRRQKYDCLVRKYPDLRYSRQYKKRSNKEKAYIWGSPYGVAGRADWDLYSFLTTSWYCAYKGSLTVPPCSQRAYYRVLDLPMTMSRDQYKRIQRALLMQLDDHCEYSAVAHQGKVNRPLQRNKNRIWCCSRNDWEPMYPFVNYTFPEDYHTWKIQSPIENRR